MAQHPFIPVIVGTDLNAYNMSASFHEEYGVKPYLLGQVSLGFTHYSNIIAHIKLVDHLHDTHVFVQALLDYAKEIPANGAPLLLVGTSDEYVRLIIENQETLSDHYVFNVLTEDLLNQLTNKERFYELAAAHGLPIPETIVYQMGDPLDFTIPHFPVIVKPSNSVLYNAHPFPGKEKVYRLESQQEVVETIQKIAGGGYPGKLLIQEYIEGDDTYNWDSVLYLNQASQAQFVSFGQVALQEHEATAVGNYTAIISRYNHPVMKQLKEFLEAIHYTGFANFDMKYDTRTETFKVFEVNVRQGRSSYYVTQMGHNLTRYLVADVIQHQHGECTYIQQDNLFTVVPKNILRDYIKNPMIRQEAMDLIKAGKWGNPLFYKGDHSLVRKLYLAVRQYRYRAKYKNAKWS
ncbi:MAG: hypothetical protein Q4A67_02055 [Aerococcus sp.]|nr:hypothetical protein [Aerococcus sp.]